MKLSAKELGSFARLHGRTLLDPNSEILWFNWSCSGFTVRFRGKTLRARLSSIANHMVMPIFQIDTMEYPCIGIRDESQPGEGYLSRPLLEERDAAYTLFDGAEGEHTISVIKLSENSRGKSGLMELETDGEFLPPEEVKPSLYIEVVGDSISCGYGNESTEPGFRTQEENGERAYGALAAKELKADYSCIAVSGCSVAAPTWLPGPDDSMGMEDMYRYTDCLLEKELGRSEYTLWDFKAKPVDAVVINLGTNDATEIKMKGFSKESIDRFERHYEAFIESVRALNGPDTLILCTLGSMDYYLYDNIKTVVNNYIRRTGDSRIKCRKFGGIIPFTEGIGADTHPSAATHVRMGHELAQMLRDCLGLE
ncbi:MAG: SGNH/GDSL hydrolase family protein [Papillibacter sp.]|jgi:lysophospholipase L1-like esterase|nr:SGNH/GDSL hydrolase family protein [Papillibacter sp.]